MLAPSHRLLFSLILFALPCVSQQAAQQATPEPDAALRQRLGHELERLRAGCGAPGLSAAVCMPDGNVVAVAAGVRELGAAAALEPDDRMFCGSVGKTWFAAVALKLVAERRLSLDDLAAAHLGEEPWFARLPNHETITVRNLMRHDSGLPRWIEQQGAMAAWRERETWRDGDQLAFVFDREPLHEAGKGWAYSDTNYIVLGLIVEKVAGRPIYDLVQERVNARLGLRQTTPGNRREIPGLVQGHLQVFARMGFAERSMQDGRLVFDPSAEWCGGGIVTSASDLARWARAWGRDDSRVRDAVEAPQLGQGVRYGLGVMLRDSELGPTRGHDGIFLGYGATMRWFEGHDLAVAVLANSDGAARALPAAAVALAKVALAQPGEGGGRE